MLYLPALCKDIAEQWLISSFFSPQKCRCCLLLLSVGAPSASRALRGHPGGNTPEPGCCAAHPRPQIPLHRI